MEKIIILLLLFIFTSCENIIPPEVIEKNDTIIDFNFKTYNIYVNYTEENKYYYEVIGAMDHSWHKLVILGKTNGTTYTKEDSLKYNGITISKDTFDILIHQTNDTSYVKKFVEYRFNFYHGNLTNINYTYYNISEISSVIRGMDYTEFNGGIEKTEFPVRFVNYRTIKYKNYIIK